MLLTIYCIGYFLILIFQSINIYLKNRDVEDLDKFIILNLYGENMLFLIFWPISVPHYCIRKLIFE